MMAQRRLEWWLSTYTILWGSFLLASPGALDGPAYHVMRLWAPPAAWGGAAAAAGMFHVWALYINGRRLWSPHVRVAATIFNAAVFTLALGGVIAASWHGVADANATAAIYIGPVWAGICAFRVAASDSCFALRTARRERAGVGA